MIRIGITGLGFMGMVHYLSYEKIAGAQVVAIADRHKERRRGDWTGIKGNFGPAGKQESLAGVATYESPEELIADADVDVVDICLPPSAHAEVAVQALAAGKHVFCEKPLALSPSDCDRTIAAANEADRHLLVGHVLPYFPEYAWALREINSGEHGRLLGASFTRVISDPSWLQNYWRDDLVGGPLHDLHVHDAHFIGLAFGKPRGVQTRGSLRQGLPEHWHSLLSYGVGGPTVQVTGGVINQPGRPFLHGFEIRMERATLAFEFAVEQLKDGEHAAYTQPPTIYRPDAAERFELGDGDPMHAFHAELKQVVEVVSAGADPGPLGAGLARDAIHLCQVQSENLKAQQ